MSLSKISVLVLSLAAVICMAGTVASADIGLPSTDGWTLVPVVNGSNITFVLSIDNMSDLVAYDGAVTKTWGDPTLADSSKFLALGDGGVLESLKVTVDGDPAVALDFHYTAGAAGNDVSFLSNIVHFDVLNPSTAYATAGITVTDIDGNGATATGLFGGKMYRASYAALPTAGWTNFVDLVGGPVTATMYTSKTAEESVGPINISRPVSDIKSEFSFHLSALDSASGTSNFEITPVPEPASMVALLSGCVGLVGLIRRKRA